MRNGKCGVQKRTYGLICLPTEHPTQVYCLEIKLYITYQLSLKTFLYNFPFLHTIQTLHTQQDFTHTRLTFSDLAIYIYIYALNTNC